MEKTIKELADELGVSKDKVKYQVRKLPREFSSKKNGITYLSDDAVSEIKGILGGSVGKKIPSEKSGNLPSDYLLVEIKKKDNELLEKNKQIENLISNQKHLQKLLDQQQILTLQANKKIEELEYKMSETEIKKEEEILPKEEKKEEKKKNFWHRFFGKGE